MSNVIELEIKNLISEIIDRIKNNNVDIVDLCDRLYLSDSGFVDIINNPKNNFSLYLEILDIIEEL